MVFLSDNQLQTRLIVRNRLKLEINEDTVLQKLEIYLFSSEGGWL